MFYIQKKTKFGVSKFEPKKGLKNNINSINKIYKIDEKWLINNFNNCRYSAFITMFYFNISSFLIKE